MKETRFIAQNKEKWHESETLLASPVKDPEKLSTLFTQVVDDLSFSRTYYPNRSVRVYLNKIARQYFSIIYGHKKEKRKRFMLFWLDELPQIIIYCRKQLITSFLFFLLAAAIGVFSSVKDPQFVSTILGESYVEMTNENIEQGDPMAVYKKGHQVDMFLGITLNNLMVAFRIYVFGVFLAIGSLAILLYNGIMVGCFQFFFVQHGLFVESALTIWLHGTLEISSIILAGGAGLTLGAGLVFPGTYSRLQAFQLSAMRSLKLMLGITPIFVLAAIIESFLTRYTEAPDALRLLLILLSAAFIIGYFVIYPWMKSQKGFDVPLAVPRLAPQSKDVVSYSRLKSNAEILQDTFLFYSRFINKLLPWIAIVSLCFATACFFLKDPNIYLAFADEWWHELFTNISYMLETPTPVFILINTICASAIFYRTMMLIHGEANKTPAKFNILAFIQVAVMTSVMYGGIYLGGLGMFLVIISFSLPLLMAFTQLTEKRNLLYGMAKGWTLFRGNPKQLIELQFILVILPFSFLAVLSAPLLYMYASILKWNFAQSDEWATHVIRFLEIFIKSFSFYLVLPMLAAGASYLYFNLKEIISAHYLKESIAQLGTGIRGTKKIR